MKLEELELEQIVLDNRTERLIDFMESPKWLEAGELERVRIAHQVKLMQLYGEILADRIRETKNRSGKK